MKRKILTIMLCGALAISAVGCNKQTSAPKGDEILVQDPEENAEGDDASADAEDDNKEETPAEAQDNQDDTQEEQADGLSDFSFADFTDLAFYFSSGAGGWWTELYINADGSFTGHYQDSDMGSTGENYPDGTVYICDFNGKFVATEKVDDYTYRLKLDNLFYDNKTNTEEIIDGVRYVYSEPYGLQGTNEMLLYLKGKPVAELSEEYLMWVRYSGMEEGAEVLPFVGLYNEPEECGFSSYEKTEGDAGNQEDPQPDSSDSGKTASNQNVFDEVVAKSAEMEERFDKGDLDQMSLNQLAYEYFDLWDGELNRLWGELKSTLDSEAMDKLRTEQRKWIAERDNQSEEAGAEYEGGSMQSMVESMTAANLTKDRAYYLMDCLLAAE